MTEQPHLYQVEDGWIEVYGGTQVHFAAPTSEELQIEAIAHSLSQLCRYNGHTKRFYPVIEHVCLMSDWVMRQPWATPRDGLTALHHDDAEFVIGDMARPIKVTMPEFKAAEFIIDTAIAKKFGTIFPFPGWLKDIDARILRDERPAVMLPSPYDWGTDELEPLGVRFWHFTGRWAWLSKKRFLRRHRKLMSLMWDGQLGDIEWEGDPSDTAMLGTLDH